MSTRLPVHMDICKGSNEHTEVGGDLSAPGDSLKAKENCCHVQHHTHTHKRAHVRTHTHILFFFFFKETKKKKPNSCFLYNAPSLDWARLIIP